MSNPFSKASRIRHLLSLLVLIAFSFSSVPFALADDFDFSDEGFGDESGDDSFDFSDSSGDSASSEPVEEEFVMPTSGKPVNLVYFEPVDGTPQSTLDQLTESTLTVLKDEKYAEFDSVKGIPLIKKLSEMTEDDRIVCVDDPTCISGLVSDLGAANIIIGRIYTEGRDRPQMTFDMIEIGTASSKNSIFFDTQARLRKQEQDIAGAMLRLFNIDMGSMDSLLGPRVVEESDPLPLGQMVGGIVVGVVALAAIGTGIYFGLEADAANDKVNDAIKHNENIGDIVTDDTSHFDETYSQVQTKKHYDDAQDKAMIANILYASGAVAAVVSVILFLVRSDKDSDDLFASQEIYVSPSIDNEGGGVVAGFTF